MIKAYAINIVLLALSCCPVCGQTNAEESQEPMILQELISILKSEEFSFQQLDAFWKKSRLSKRTRFEGDIEGGLVRENISLSGGGTFYDLNIIKSDSGLVCVNITEGRERTLVFNRVEKAEFEKVDFNFYTYGIACGIAGRMPDKCEEMLHLVNERDYVELAGWLHSINPEKATYGYIGIDFLHREGVDILPADMERMGQLREFEIQINTCEGCTSGIPREISDILTKKYLNQIYRLFKRIRRLD